MKILIDMDGIVANLHDKWYSVYNQESGDNLTMDKVVTWDTHLYITGKPQHLYGIICRDGFYDDLQPIEGAIQVISRLARYGHDIRFCTATPSADGARAKMARVDRHFESVGWRGHKQVILTHDKHWLSAADLLIDDSPSNLAKFPKRKIAIHYPYNEGVEGVYYTEDWKNPKQAWDQIGGLVAWFSSLERPPV